MSVVTDTINHENEESSFDRDGLDYGSAAIFRGITHACGLTEG